MHWEIRLLTHKATSFPVVLLPEPGLLNNWGGQDSANQSPIHAAYTPSQIPRKHAQTSNFFPAQAPLTSSTQANIEAMLWRVI